MKSYTYRTIIEKDGKGYRGYVPALPGCHTYGLTIEKTQRNLKEAMEGWITARRNLNWPVPEDNLIETLQTIMLPADSHARAYA